MQQTELLLTVAIALTALCAALLSALLIRTGRLLRAQRADQRRQEQLLQQLGDDLFNELARQGDDQAVRLNNTGDRLLSTLTQTAQSQSALLESMQRQVLLSTRNQEERAGQSAAAMTASLTRLDAQMDALRQSNAQQLLEMRRTVDEKLTQSLDKRLNDSFSLVSQRLEQVYRGLGEMQSLASGVGDLKRVLTNVKTRGIWGEMQLGALLRQVLSPGQYEENVAVVPGASERVEFALRLPGQQDAPVYLPIDSKFPQEDYLRLTEASQTGDVSAVEEARKALAARIRQEAKRISTKYVLPPHTTDFAVMFLPVEGLYAEAVQQPGLMEAVQRDYRIVVAGPSTFSALLNALQMGFRTLAIERRTSEVWKLLGAVKADFGRFAETLEKTRQRLQQATESIDTAFARTRSIERRLGAVEETGESRLPEEP